MAAFGALVRWCVGACVCWCVDVFGEWVRLVSLVRWCIGAFGCWCVDAWVRSRQRGHVVGKQSGVSLVCLISDL